jgi:hypothetical protein
MTGQPLERRLAARLADAAPAPRWELLEQVMGEVDATPQRRRRPWWPDVLALPGRRDISNGLVLLLLLAALLAGGLVALGLGRRVPPPAPVRIEATALPLPPATSAAGVSVNSVVEFHGLAVAVGTSVGADGTIGGADDRAMVWRSDDLGAWTGASDPSFDGASMAGVATDGGRLVAVGERSTGAVAWTSNDGSNWRAVDVASVPIFSGPMAFAYGRFFAAGCATETFTPCDVYSSPDGEHWTMEVAGGSVIRAIRPTSAGLYVVGGGANAKVFDPAFVLLFDGTRWRRAVPAIDTPSFGITDVVERGDQVVGIGIYDDVRPTFGVGYWYATASGTEWEPLNFIGDFHTVQDVRAIPGVGGAVALEDGASQPVPFAFERGAVNPVLAGETAPSVDGAHTNAVIRMADGTILAIGSAPAIDGGAPTAWRISGSGL